MGVFSQDFLAEQRQKLMDIIDKFEYQVDDSDTWLEATEQSREVSGNYIKFTFIFPNTLQSAYRITGFRVLNESGTIIAERDLSIEINSTQTIMFVFKVSYQEV